MKTLLTLLGGVRATIFASLAAAALLWGGWQYLAKNDATNALKKAHLAQIQDELHMTRQIAQLYEDKVQAVNKVSKQAEVKRNEQKAQYERTIADLRRGAIVVRDKFTCPASPTKAPSDSSAPVGASPGGLQTEDVEFLLSESERADQLAVDYNELLEILKEIVDVDPE